MTKCCMFCLGRQNDSVSGRWYRQVMCQQHGRCSVINNYMRSTVSLHLVTNLFVSVIVIVLMVDFFFLRIIWVAKYTSHLQEVSCL